MTFGAVLPEPALMYIPVAVSAVLMVHSLENLEFLPVPEFFFMAFDTGYLPVLSF